MGGRVSLLARRSVRPLSYASGLLALRGDDVLLSSFPRSGSTWVRLFLCNLISLTEWNGGAVDLRLLNETMPELGISNLVKPWHHPSIPRVVKTHKPWTPLLRRFRAVGLVRDPRDVMVSRYHRLGDRVGLYEGSFAGFVGDHRLGLEAWFRHFASWRGRWAVIIRYEDLLDGPDREFGRLLEILKIRAPGGLVREAITRSSFESARRVEGRLPSTNGDGAMFRRGSAGQWHSYFGDEESALYRELAERFDVRIYH
jgi:estrone sulfotransferase